jgi:general secretion pathway protein G
MDTTGMDNGMTDKHGQPADVCEQMRKRTATRRRRRRQRQQGMTLIEIMIVMVIMALVAAGAGFAIVPQLQKAKIKSTQQDAKAIAAAVEMYMAENKGCPTVQKLLEEKILNKKNHTKDAWDNDFAIDCDEDGATVKSGGPDGQLGNDDDVE